MTRFGTALLSSGSLVDIDATLFIQLGIFLLMLVLLRKLLFQPVIRVVEARHDATDGATEAANALREEADRLNDKFEKKLEEVRSTVKVDRERIVDEAHRQEREIIRKARAEAHDLLTKMREETANEASKTRAQLENEVVSLADMVAQKILNRKL